jgi:hypothetical protein
VRQRPRGPVIHDGRDDRVGGRRGRLVHGRRSRGVRGIGLAGAAGALLLNCACTHASAAKLPASKFHDASAVVIESTQAYLRALNKTERDHYLDDRVASQAPIQLREIEAVQVFDAAGIAARLDALERLTDYTELLYAVTTSPTPLTVKPRAKDLATAVARLSGEVETLTGEDDARFKKVAAGVFPVLADVLRAVVDQQSDRALKRALVAGAAQVNALIDVIARDAELAYERKRTALSKRRADAALAYNLESAKGPKTSPSALRRLANAVSDIEDQWEAFRIARPTDGLEAMRRANLALQAFARVQRPGARDYAAFADATEVFASAAARVGHGVTRLADLDQRGSR